MPDTATLDRPAENVASPPPPVRTGRRAAARHLLVRRLLALTAGLGIAASVLAFVALSRPQAAKPQVRLPAGGAANAAFNLGLAQSKPLAATPKMTAAATPAGTTAVAIKNYAFAPAALTVKVGTKVTWTNDDTAPHTVTVDSGPVKFNSPTLQKGDSFTYTFTTPGTYSYYCAVHPDMVASVTVTGSGPTGPPSTPAPSPTTSTSGMPMPSPAPGGGGQTCEVSTALQALLTHVATGHLGESPEQQVKDILDVDQYIGTHLALVNKMIEPLTSGGLSSAVSTTLQSLLTHIATGHLGESPQQQVKDILDVNQYVATHLALVQKMLSGWEALAC
jgi:plastocyanin